MEKFSIEKKYLYIALIFGILFVFIVPPFQSPDEDSHFKKAYQVSKGKLYPEVKKNVIGNYFPTEMLNYIKTKTKYIGNRDKKYKYSEMVLDQYTKLNYEERKFTSYSTVSVTPIAYLVPATGIIFSKICAKIFDLESINTAYMLYFARFFSIIFMSFIMYLSIKITPVFKRTFAVFGLIPMVIFLGSVISYDSLLISLTTLALSIILKITYDDKLKKVPNNYIITLILIGVVLLNVKGLYFLLYILLFLIPVKKVGNIKKMTRIALIIILSILAITLVIKIPFLLLPKIKTDVNYASKQLNFVIHNPIKYSGILIDNIINQRFFQLSSIVGVFGLIDTYNPFVIICFTYIWLIMVSISDGVCDKIKINGKFKILLIIYILFIIISVYSAMYINWTPAINGHKIGEADISGVQGRYFLPILLPILLLFSNKKIKRYSFIEKIRNNIFMPCIVILLVSTMTILFRYWA
jgi:membrane protein, related to actinobacillus protein (1944168)